MAEITANDVQGMVSHWLATPPNGYLGGSYGSDKLSLLQQPFGAGVADAFIVKAREDLPVLQQLPPGGVNVFAQQIGVDRLDLTFEVANVSVPITPDSQRVLADPVDGLHAVVHQQLPAAAG